MLSLIWVLDLWPMGKINKKTFTNYLIDTFGDLPLSGLLAIMSEGLPFYRPQAKGVLAIMNRFSCLMKS